MKRSRRRSYFVDGTLQGRVIVHTLIQGGLVILMFCSGVFVPVLWQLGGTSRETSYEAATVMIYMHESFWLLALVSAVLATITSIRFSHRIAGPMVRYKRNLRLLADGKLPPPLRTRKGDLMQDEVAALNEAVQGVGVRADAVRGAQLALRRELTIALDVLDAEQRHRLLPMIKACDELEVAVRAFRHVDPQDESAAVTNPAAIEVVQGC